jgi:glycosyltransferase involved in cell wall biosynthesis
MRIAYLSVSDQLGGSEIALLEMIKGLRRQRPSWKVHLILPGRGPLLDRAEVAGADCVVVTMPASVRRVGEFAATGGRWRMARKAVLYARLAAAALAMPGYLRMLRRAVRSQHPSILHTNGFKAHVLGAKIANGATPANRMTLVWHVHEYVGDRGLSRSLLRSHRRAVSAIVANSASVAADVRHALSPSAPVHVVHNAVDLAAFTPDGPAEDLDARAGWRAPERATVRVGLVGTFARWKGHDVFLRALAALPLGLAVRGYVIGEPLYDTAGSQYTLAELRALAAELGLTDRVGFTGFLRPAPAMRALDVVVHASTRPEPFGLVIAEAMACGRAVVTSACGGAGELVRPDVDALTHPPGDSTALSRVIERLATDSPLRLQLGERARSAACERFNPDRLASELVTLYEGLARAER